MTFNPLRPKCPSHTETSQLICRANQLTVFYMRETLAVKGLTTQLLISKGTVPQSNEKEL